MSYISIDVEDRSGNRLGAGPITTAFDLQHDDPLSAAAEFSFSVPARDTRASLLTLIESVVRIYVDGEQVFLGLVEEKDTQITPSGVAIYNISGRSLLVELVENSVHGLSVSDGSNGDDDGPSTAVARAPGWSLDTTNGYATTSRLIYARFVGESVLEALTMMSDRIREHFIYRPQLSGSDRQVIWIRGATVDSGVRAIQGSGEPVALESNPDICLIQDLNIVEDAHDLINLVFPYGAGQGAARLDLSASSYGQIEFFPPFQIYPPDNYIDYAPTGYTIPQREIDGLEFKEISPISNTDADLQAAADMLADATMRWLERYGEPQVFYDLDVVQLPARVQPGQTIQVIYYEEDAGGTVVHDIDTDLIVLNIATRYGNDGARFYRLRVSSTDRQPDSDSSVIVGRMREGRVFQAHPQMAPNSYTTSYREEFTDDHEALLPFFFGSEIAQIASVLLRFKVTALRSTVKAVNGVSTTTSSGGGTTVSSADGGGTVASSSDYDPTHSHPIILNDGFSGTTVFFLNGALYTNGGGTVYTGNTSIPHAHQVTVPAHTHQVTIPDHTHDLTPNVSLEYGLYEDSGGSVVDDPADTGQVVVEINGSTPTNAIEALGNDWYQIDLTPDVAYGAADTYPFRPRATAHEVTVSGGIGYQGTVRAQVQIRSIIQEVAFL